MKNINSTPDKTSTGEQTMWRFSVTKPYVVEAGLLSSRSIALFDSYSQIFGYLLWSSNLTIWKYKFVCVSLTVLHVQLGLVFFAIEDWPYRSYIFFLSSFRLTRDYCHAQEQQQQRNLSLQDEITFWKNKLYIYNLQKELRVGTAWSVNKNPQYSNQHSHWNFIKLLLLCVTLGFKEKKNMWACHLLFVQSFFLFALLFSSCQGCIYPYIILYFLFWNLPLKSQYRRTHLVPTTVSLWITGKY